MADRDLLRGDRAIEALQNYVANAIEKVRLGDADSVADKLAEIMPGVLTALYDVVTAADSTPSQRKWALETILAVFVRVSTMRIKETKTSVAKTAAQARRERAAAVAARAKADARQADLEAKKLAKREARAAARVEREAKRKAEKEQKKLADTDEQYQQQKAQEAQLDRSVDDILQELRRGTEGTNGTS